MGLRTFETLELIDTFLVAASGVELRNDPVDSSSAPGRSTRRWVDRATDEGGGVYLETEGQSPEARD